MKSNTKAKCKTAVHFVNSIVGNDEVLEAKGCQHSKHFLCDFVVIDLEDL